MSNHNDRRIAQTLRSQLNLDHGGGDWAQNRDDAVGGGRYRLRLGRRSKNLVEGELEWGHVLELGDGKGRERGDGRGLDSKRTHLRSSPSTRGGEEGKDPLFGRVETAN